MQLSVCSLLAVLSVSEVPYGCPNVHSHDLLVICARVDCVGFMELVGKGFTMGVSRRGIVDGCQRYVAVTGRIQPVRNALVWTELFFNSFCSCTTSPQEVPCSSASSSRLLLLAKRSGKCTGIKPLSKARLGPFFLTPVCGYLLYWSFPSYFSIPSVCLPSKSISKSSDPPFKL